MTYVSRVVQDWLQVALEQEDQGIHHAWLYSWPSFVKEMHTYFGILDVVAEAAHSLDHLRMNSDDQIASYNIAFLWYSTESQWTENTLCHRYYFYFGLPDCIQDIISTCEGGKPSTFQTLYSTAVSINNHFCKRKREFKRAPQRSLYPEYSESVSSVSHLLLSNPSSDVEALESSDKSPTQQHILFPDLSNFVSELLLSISNFGFIVSKSFTSAPFSALQQILLSELSDSAFLISGSGPRISESLVKLESLVDSLSGLGSNLSSESLF